jgi:hypothetical protein
MRKERPDKSGRAPPIDTLSRHYLARGLMQRPDARKHVANVDDIEDMELLALLKLAQKMGVDAEALAETVEREENARFRYSEDFPAFVGRIEFDFMVEVFGKRVTRKVRADYTYTPEWRYWDLKKNAEHEGWSGSSIKAEFLTVPEEDNGDIGESEWKEADLLAIDAVWNTVEDTIEEQCKVEDAERRRLAAQSAVSSARRTRARH